LVLIPDPASVGSAQKNSDHGGIEPEAESGADRGISLVSVLAETEAFAKADESVHGLVYPDGFVYVTGQSDPALVVATVSEAIGRFARP
jgi:hypothetical protein